MGHLGHSIRIARIESRRSFRNTFGTKRKLAYTGGFLLLFSPILFEWGQVGYRFGQTIAEGAVIPSNEIGVQLLALAAMFVAFSAIRTVQAGRPDGIDFLLTATSSRAVLLGTLVHQTVQVLTFISIPSIIVIGGFALGTGTLTVLPLGVLVLLPLFTAATLLGTVLGMLFSMGLLTNARLRQASKLIGLLVFLGVMTLSFALTYPAASGSPSPLARLPLTDFPLTNYVDLIFLGSGLSDGISPASLGSLLLVLGSIPVLSEIAIRLVPRLWFADVDPGSLLNGGFSQARPEEVESEIECPRPGSAVSSNFPKYRNPPSVGLAYALWVRWRRVPVRFSPVIPLLGILVSVGIAMVVDPAALPILIPVALVAIGVYVSGGLFGLNPLGEGLPVRELEAITPLSSEKFVRGYIVAGLMFGVPITVIAGISFVFFNSIPTTIALMLIALSLFASILSASVALLFGTVFPQYEQTETFGGLTVASPTPWALLSHMFFTGALLFIGTVPALAASLISGLRGFLLVGAGTSLALLSIFILATYRLSVARFENEIYS